jgi:hypothetical protein
MNVNEAWKGPLFVIAIIVLAAVIFGLQAATGKQWKKGLGGYTVVELDDSTRAVYKWIAIVALSAALILAGYTFIALR